MAFAIAFALVLPLGLRFSLGRFLEATGQLYSLVLPMQGGRVGAKVLLFDIENTPNLAYTWGKYQQDVNRFAKEWWMLCFGYKWLDEKATHVLALPDFPGYAKDKSNDRALVQELRDLIDEADVVVAHNGDRFDMPKAKARWLIHGIDPPSPVKQIDTLKIARLHFMFNSNSLGDLGETLGLGGKGDTGGFDTWLECMAGDPVAWRRMIKYCRQDVRLLEKVYLRMLPYIERHPNLALISGRPEACPKCGVVGRMIKRHGPDKRTHYKFNNVTANASFQCTACRSYVSVRIPDKTVEPPRYKNG